MEYKGEKLFLECDFYAVALLGEDKDVGPEAVVGMVVEPG